ncbi:hypothetical protein LIER_28460 [Lithospermum erythrorhizon]|uniref:Uncharacterized protein n=1 Tax=Lithospermum erythrorhizon TaxID=34254 RepID=A0AAV3RLR2_LITER
MHNSSGREEEGTSTSLKLTPSCQERVDIVAGGTIWEKTPTRLFNLFEVLGTGFQEVVEEVSSPSSEKFDMVEELENDSVIVEGVDSITYVEKLGEIEDLDVIVEWVDMT